MNHDYQNHRERGRKIPHPVSSRFDNDDGAHLHERNHGHSTSVHGMSLAKRRKLESGRSSSSRHLGSTEKVELNVLSLEDDQNALVLSSLDDDVNQAGSIESEKIRTTQLEIALPPVQTDAEAIEAYEASRAAQIEDDEAKDGEESLLVRMDKQTWRKGRSSIYVDAFNLALETVLQDEGHLFDDAERQVFQCWYRLTYEAQYLYTRLFLRKTSAWFRVGRLGYHGDIADLEAAVLELQMERQLPPTSSQAENFPGEAVLPDEARPLGSVFTFAECSDEQITTLDEASSLLLLDELKVIAKHAKVAGKNKSELLRNLRRTSGQQRGLGFFKRSETEDSAASEGTYVETDEDTADDVADNLSTVEADTAHHMNRDELFTKKILEQTGSCVRLSLIPLKLFERVHLVFYRSTEWTEKSLTTLILAKIARRNFPDYIVSRSANVFESRSLLLEFEASLRTQFRVDSILEFNGTPSRKGHEEVRSIFEAVYPRWQELVAQEQLKEERVYESGEGAYLRRFNPAWVYTRIVHKALAILARFKEHMREHNLICELLNQRLFHAARRGLWYQRKALLEEHYMFALHDTPNLAEDAKKRYWKQIALRTCEEGLRDNECHIIYHYDLQKRIKKLEKQLKIPKREQHEFGHVGLSKALERTVEGLKIEKEEAARRTIRRRESATGSRSQSAERNSAPPPVPSELPTNRGSMKTIWLDELDTAEEVSVESMCLSHYRKKLGFKGYHSEGGILRTLFGLLFYDVLFMSYVPNVFQTAYQTCPLDLHTDAFYSARISEIITQVNRIANGEAEQIIRDTWNQHSGRKTCVVGVRWDEYEFEDLLEIARCWKGEALGTVMKVMAQEYASRGGGVPDLFLWSVNPVEEQAIKGYGKVMFVEVKSENDRLSDTQRLWISVLLNAGVEVELCHANAREVIVR